LGKVGARTRARRQRGQTDTDVVCLARPHNCRSRCSCHAKPFIYMPNCGRPQPPPYPPEELGRLQPEQ
jgi:hypothetical protein